MHLHAGSFRSVANGIYQAKLARHALWRGHLWQREGNGLRRVGIEEVSGELRPVLPAFDMENR